jgi:mitochondrial protein import protein ZIM17
MHNITSAQRILKPFASSYTNLRCHSSLVRVANRVSRRPLPHQHRRWHTPLTGALIHQLRFSSTSSPAERSAQSAPGSSFKSATSKESSRENVQNASSPSPDLKRPFKIPQQLEGVPHYRMTFTCKPCGTRSTHRISKHGYHKGTILIRCPSCKNRHLISDHLNIFSDKKVTVEDILRSQNQKIRRGSIAESASESNNEDDIEFWDENTPTEEPQLVEPRQQK